nr:DUF3576 domain-containing protein [Rhodovibrio salinarum]
MLALTACAGGGESDYPGRIGGDGGNARNRDGSVLGGDGGVELLGTDEEAPQGGTGIGVNAYLWRASLDTLSFMPVDSADPFGGVVLTDWYSPPETPNERFKVNLYILGRQLRADGLRVSVFRQERGPDGTWRDVEVQGQTATELENAILARAREMRIASTQ